MYQWAIKVTTELLDGDSVAQTTTEVRTAASENEARARYAAVMDHLAHPGRQHPKYQRISAVELVRRPIGEWEQVQA